MSPDYAVVSASSLSIAFGSRSIASNRARAGASGAAALLPVAQGADRQLKRPRKNLLRHAKTLSQHFDARHAPHSFELAHGHRLSIGVGLRRGDDIAISHPVDARPVRPAFCGALTGFNVTRIVLVLLMSCCLPGRDDPACVHASHRRRDEQDVSTRHSIDSDALLAAGRMFDVLQPIRIFQSSDGISKIEPMLASIFGGLAISLITHGPEDGYPLVWARIELRASAAP